MQTYFSVETFSIWTKHHAATCNLQGKERVFSESQATLSSTKVKNDGTKHSPLPLPFFQATSCRQPTYFPITVSSFPLASLRQPAVFYSPSRSLRSSTNPYCTLPSLLSTPPAPFLSPMSQSLPSLHSANPEPQPGVAAFLHSPLTQPRLCLGVCVEGKNTDGLCKNTNNVKWKGKERKREQ